MGTRGRLWRWRHIRGRQPPSLSPSDHSAQQMAGDTCRIVTAAARRVSLQHRKYHSLHSLLYAMRRQHRVLHHLCSERSLTQLTCHPRASLLRGCAAASPPPRSRFSTSAPSSAPLPSFSHLLFEPFASLLSITLNRASVHNAFNDEVIAELTTAFTHPLLLPPTPSPTSPRCVLLRSTGPSFSAGADLHWMQRMRSYSEADNLRDASALFDMLSAIAACPVPVIARVQGSAYGGGVGLVAACDFAFALHSASFALTEVKLGLSPATISPFVLSKTGTAGGRYLLTGEKFSADTAHQLGLVSGLHEDEAGMDAAIARVVKDLRAAGPEAVRKTKALIRAVSGQEERVAQVKSYTTRLIAGLRVSEEGQEGIASFLERRQPRWKERDS